MSNTITRGSELQLFYNGNTLAYATSHTLTQTAETSSISTKDNGINTSNVVTSLTWEVTAENLYTDDDFDTLDALYQAGEPIDIVLSRVSNFSTKGLVATGGDVQAWASDSTNYRTGKAIITNLSVNANAGEYATYSITLTGTGALKKMPTT